MTFMRWKAGPESAPVGVVIAPAPLIDAHRTAERIRSQARSQQRALAAKPHAQMLSRIAGTKLAAFGTLDSRGAGAGNANGWLIPFITEENGGGPIVETAVGCNRLLKSMSHERGMRNFTDAASHSQKRIAA
jgi:hypothetical protein